MVNDLVEQINLADRYDLVAITAMTAQAPRAYQIADAFRQRNVPVVMGGIHVTALPEEAKQHADSVVIGEAENLWPELVADCENKSLKPHYCAPTPPDMSNLVIPRWDHMNMGIYWKALGFVLPAISIFVTRGCPNDCAFCTVTKFFGRTYRTKPIANVLRELDAGDSKVFNFMDDNIGFNPDYSRELFHALAARRKKITWGGSISTQVLRTPDLIELAGKAGCRQLFVGIESVNTANLEAVNKRFNKVEQYEELVQRFRRAGINPLFSFIFGFDGDTPDVFDVTLEFLRRHRIGLACLCS